MRWSIFLSLLYFNYLFETCESVNRRRLFGGVSYDSFYVAGKYDDTKSLACSRIVYSETSATMSNAIYGLTNAFSKSNYDSGLLYVIKSTGVRISDYLLHNFIIVLCGALGMAASIILFVVVVIYLDRVSFVTKAGVNRFQIEVQSIEDRDSDQEDRILEDPDIPKLRHVGANVHKSKIKRFFTIRQSILYPIRVIFHFIVTVATIYLCFLIWQTENKTNALANASHCVAFSLADFFIDGTLPDSSVITDLKTLSNADETSWVDASDNAAFSLSRIQNSDGTFSRKSIQGLYDWNEGVLNTPLYYTSTIGNLSQFTGWKGLFAIAANATGAFDMLTGNPSSSLSTEAQDFKKAISYFAAINSHTESDLSLIISGADTLSSFSQTISTVTASAYLAGLLTLTTTPSVTYRAPTQDTSLASVTGWTSVDPVSILEYGPLTLLQDVFFNGDNWISSTLSSDLVTAGNTFGQTTPIPAAVSLIGEHFEDVFFSTSTTASESTTYPLTGPTLSILQTTQQVSSILDILKVFPAYREGGMLFIRYVDIRGTLIYLVIVCFIGWAMVGITFVIVGGPLAGVMPLKPPDTPSLIICVLSILFAGACMLVYMVTSLSGVFMGDAPELALRVLDPDQIVNYGSMLGLTSNSTSISDASLKEWLKRIGSCTSSSSARLFADSALDPTVSGTLSETAASDDYSRASSVLKDTDAYSSFWSPVVDWALSRAQSTSDLFLGELVDSGNLYALLNEIDVVLTDTADLSTKTLSGMGSRQTANSVSYPFYSSNPSQPTAIDPWSTASADGYMAQLSITSQVSTSVCDPFLLSPEDSSATVSNPNNLPCTFINLRGIARSSVARVIHNLNTVLSRGDAVRTMYASYDGITQLESFIQIGNSDTYSEGKDSCGFLHDMLSTDIPFWFGNLSAALATTSNYWALMALIQLVAAFLFYHEWIYQVRIGLSKRAFPYDRSMLVIDERYGSAMYPMSSPFGIFVTSKFFSSMSVLLPWWFKGCSRRRHKRLQALSGIKVANEYEERVAHYHLSHKREEQINAELRRRRQLAAVELESSNGGESSFKVQNMATNATVYSRSHHIQSELLGVKSLVEESAPASVMLDKEMKIKRKRWNELRNMDKIDMLEEELNELNMLDRQIKFALRRASHAQNRRFSQLVDELMLARQEAEKIKYGDKVSAFFKMKNSEWDDEDEDDDDEIMEDAPGLDDPPDIVAEGEEDDEEEEKEEEEKKKKEVDTKGNNKKVSKDDDTKNKKQKK